MKSVSNNYKTQIKTAGRQIKSEISYNINNTDYLLTDDDLYSVKPYFKGDILKSVMKQLDFNCKENIPLNTIVNYKFGLLVNGQYEMIDFGNYVVYKTEKNEETQSYEITCYDKMLYSMKDYEQMNITYPITIRNYINAICEHLGLTFKNASETFANYNKQIPAELYLDSQGNSLGYTFRDVLDELAQVTASTICINEEDDELEVRYINNTGDTINGDYLKNVNVNFGETTKPINTIVLSRSGGSDKIYLSYPSDLPENERNSIEIADNQIMNFNDRDTYLPDILNKLNGLTYCLNDFSSTGITYYNLCDKYNVEIGENTYSCILFNDEINVTQGLEENIYTELPKETETDYTKADKTDRRINQTYLIVDKQNQQIQSVVSSVTKQNSKISTITQKVDEIESEIQNVTGMTQTKEGLTGSITFTDETSASEPIMIKIYPIVDSISCLYPRSNLYPSSSLYSSSRKIRFRNTTTSQNIDYELPDDLLYYDSNTYDEFYLNLESQTCQVTKRCKYNADGTISALASERVDTYSYPLIELTEGIYTVSLLGYNNGYITVTLMAKNIYTDQFYTKVETDSKISQTAEDITLSVDTTLSNYSTTDEMNTQISLTATEINNTVRTKVGENEIISKINQTPESITINANKLNLQGYITASDLSGNGTSTINGSNITTGTIKSSNYVANTSGTAINLTNGLIDTKNFKVDQYGNLNCNGATLQNATFVVNQNNAGSTAYIDVSTGNFYNNDIKTSILPAVIELTNNATDGGMVIEPQIRLKQDNLNFQTILGASGCYSPAFTQTSKEEDKKNFEKYNESALNTINNIDIYKYHLKGQTDNEKKHIGFVIGSNYKYSKEITSNNNDGVDIYSFVSVCCKAIQEQQEIIENLEKRIKKLESESDK